MEPIGLGMQVPLLNLLVIMEVEDLICVVFFLLGILVISVHTRMCIGYVQCKYDAIFYKGPKHMQILVSVGVQEPSPK
jgi:hypothetical protein